MENTENKLTMELTKEEAALITKHRAKSIRKKELINQKLKEFPTLKQFLKIAKIKEEDLESGKTNVEVVIKLDSSCHKLIWRNYESYKRMTGKDEVKDIIATQYCYFCELEQFANQKLFKRTLIELFVVNNRVVNVYGLFTHSGWEYCEYNIYPLLPNFKENIIMRIRKDIADEIKSAERYLESVKSHYEAMLRGVNNAKARFGEEYNIFKQEDAQYKIVNYKED